jgi:LPS sulfotransferase NodH
MGFPDEYLNPRGPMQMWRDWTGSKNFTDYIDLVVREKSTDNGVFSLKTTYPDAAPIFGTGLTSKLFPAPRFIYLNRHDMIAQAISGHKARSSGVWHRKIDGSAYRSVPKQEPVYDREEILKLIDQYAREQMLWEKFFVLHQIKPLRLSYEDLCDNLQHALRQIFEFMDVFAPTNLASIMSVTKRLSDDVNQHWMEEFLKTFTL